MLKILRKKDIQNVPVPKIAAFNVIAGYVRRIMRERRNSRDVKGKQVFQAEKDRSFTEAVQHPCGN